MDNEILHGLTEAEAEAFWNRPSISGITAWKDLPHAHKLIVAHAALKAKYHCVLPEKPTAEVLFGITWDEVKAYQHKHMAAGGTPWVRLTVEQCHVWLRKAWEAKHHQLMPYRDETAVQKLAAKIAVAAAAGYDIGARGDDLAKYALAAASKILE